MLLKLHPIKSSIHSMIILFSAGSSLVVSVVGDSWLDGGVFAAIGVEFLLEGLQFPYKVVG